ncbi:hypothetical protein [Hydrogenophaga sp. IBVHS2]|uniref:hypothetical protein n=1 Tax=Hydrogenophaga sp. IBVHS2 TaxID=1985170 RepID=UPI000A2E4C3E|nr:hypothetical protein [Hydrogenophaga sp. IBVHS2]OSZ64860.1 hypothetical protein CAP38_10745 [Hydrogenophaga sp. IBVHS2]
MKLLTSLACALAAATLVALPARAGEGHDHGDAPPAAAGQGLPRFAAVSETFELVGVLSGKQIVLYLDRAADNSPVRGAQIELEIAGKKFKAQSSKGPQGDDEYEVVLADAPKPGVLPITATVTAGEETDLLAGELDLHEDTPAESAHTHSWKEYVTWAGGGIAALMVVGFGARRIMAARSVRAGAAA